MIPRHAFICWLAMKHRLLTRDGLLKWGVHSDVLCLFLNLEGKFRELRHLFFEMPRCKKSLENDLCLEFSLQCNPEIGWEKIVNWAEIEGSNFLPWLGGHCLSIPEMQECCVASRLS